LHHPVVHEQTFDFLSVPNSARTRGLAIDPELVAMDSYARFCEANASKAATNNVLTILEFRDVREDESKDVE